MHLEAELLTHEEIPTQCGMATQEWMATQYDQTSDTCMANRPNTRRRTGLNHLSQDLTRWLPARDNQASGPGTRHVPMLSKKVEDSIDVVLWFSFFYKPFFSL